ncbi:MAG: ribonuclease E/G [Lachnospiraceae bacterium]|nr:ribonuclease E/G [Lachnospiraceae bacterium]
MNEKKIILTKYNNGILYTCMDENRAIEYRLFNEDEEDKVGSIYVCMVRDVARNIGASFVSYGDKKTGFVKSTAYKKGTLVALQLKRRGDGDKAPLFTDELSLTGMYTVVKNSDKNFAISKKITGDTRREIKEMYSGFFADLEYGITLRTNCVGASQGEVLKEADELAGLMDDIVTASDKRTCGTLLYDGGKEWVRHCLKADAASLERIITDDTEIFETLNSSVIKKFTSLNSDIEFELYKDDLLPLDKLYSIETGLEEALKTKVWLKSGAFIYIEHTNALTAIDVNTGKNIKNTERETTFYECNMEATAEIARQIRLRNLSGIIIVDYINMTEEKHFNQVTGYLKQLISADPVKTTVHDVTALSLVEITRQKELEPLRDMLGKDTTEEETDG